MEEINIYTKGIARILVTVEWHTAQNRWKANLEDHDTISVSYSESSFGKEVDHLMCKQGVKTFLNEQKQRRGGSSRRSYRTPYGALSYPV